MTNFSTKSITVNGHVNGDVAGKDDDAESGNGHAKTRGYDSPSNGAGPAPREHHSKRPSTSPFLSTKSGSSPYHNTDSGDELIISSLLTIIWLSYDSLGL